MFLKKKTKYAFLGSAAFMLVYLFAAAVPVSNDFYFQPEWTSSIMSAAPIRESSRIGDAAEMRAFMLGDNFGFFTSDGDIFRGNTGGMRFSAGGSSWCVYPENARSTEVYAPNGARKMTVGAAGFVHLTEHGIYLFHPGGSAVSRYSENGSLIWTREEIAPITAFSDSAGATVIGYANGLFSAVDAEGRTLFSFYPGGSDYQIVLGVAVSDSARLAVCVAGIDQQRVILVEIEGGQHRITAHQNFQQGLRRQLFAGFSDSGRHAFFETHGGLGIIDTQRRAFSEVQLEGQVLNVVEYPGSGFFVALLKTEPGRHSLSLVTAAGAKAAAVSFECRDAFLLFGDGGLYLGSDTNISKINIVTPRGRKR